MAQSGKAFTGAGLAGAYLAVQLWMTDIWPKEGISRRKMAELGKNTPEIQHRVLPLPKELICEVKRGATLKLRESLAPPRDGFGEPGVDTWFLVAVSEGRWDLQWIHSISTRSAASGQEMPKIPDSGGGSTEGVLQALPWSWTKPPACLHPPRALLQLGQGRSPLPGCHCSQCHVSSRTPRRCAAAPVPEQRWQPYVP